MTLVVYIPYKDGIVVVSDNQNTFEEKNGEKNARPTEKCFVNTSKNYAIVCAGFTSVYRKMYYCLKEDSSVDSSNVKNKVKEYIEKERKNTKFGDDVNALEILIITKNSGELKILDMIDTDELDSIKSTKLWFIGSKHIHSQIWNLQLNPLKISKEDAINLGLSIIEYTAEIDRTIGRVTQYGASLVIFPKETASSLTEKGAEAKPQNLFKQISILINKGGIAS